MIMNFNHEQCSNHFRAFKNGAEAAAESFSLCEQNTGK
jgi:hypothetical protein